MAGFVLDRRTQEEKDAYNKKRYDELWFDPKRTYKYEINSHWVSGFGFYRLEDWSVHITQAECPWMTVTLETFEYRRTLLCIPKLIQYNRAVRWAKAYMKRGGPPEGHWAIGYYS